MMKCRVLVTSAVCSFLVGCGAARYTQRDATGGTLALEHDRSIAMEDAHQQMSSHCGAGNYSITSEEEVVVGAVASTRTSANVDDNSVQASTRSHSRDLVEWRVSYRCGSAAGRGSH